jgi:hypothetical protein
MDFISWVQRYKLIWKGSRPGSGHFGTKKKPFTYVSGFSQAGKLLCYYDLTLTATQPWNKVAILNSNVSLRQFKFIYYTCRQ